MKKLTLTLFLFSFIIFSTTAFSQNDNKDFNQTIKNLSTSAATGYVGPAISSFGSNLNTGWVTKAPSAAKNSFNLEIKIIAMGSIIDDAQKVFSTVGSFNFTDAQATDIANSFNNADASVRTSIKEELLKQPWTLKISGPTIMGSDNQNVMLDFQGQTVQINNQTYVLPNYSLTDVKGFLNDLSIFPTAAIQLGIGTLYGTSLAVRWFPTVNIKDLGDFTYWGFGGMHNPAVWFNQEFPIDIAVGGFYQDMKVGTIFETKASMFGLYASKTFGSVIAFTPYVALTSESSKTTVQYDYTYDVNSGGTITQKTENISFEMDGANSTGFTVGAAFKLAILNLNIDYKFANIKTASAGLTFGF
ncbi:MAG TPA: DUF6588 family protein [Ignavibacteriaceae bacterium]|nr:DUF6588 family protein [Ignavibacteriaceae bacterium]